MAREFTTRKVVSKAGRKPRATGPARATGAEAKPEAAKPAEKPRKEIGGPEGPEPTRYGDWEIKGRCIDF